MTYRGSLAFKQALTDLGSTGEQTRAHQPRTNGKVEHFNRTMCGEWADIWACTTNDHRTEVFADFLHTDNYLRCHTVLGG